MSQDTSYWIARQSAEDAAQLSANRASAHCERVLQHIKSLPPEVVKEYLDALEACLSFPIGSAGKIAARTRLDKAMLAYFGEDS